MKTLCIAVFVCAGAALAAHGQGTSKRTQDFEWKIAQRLDDGRVVIMLGDDVDLSRTEVSAVVGERMPGNHLARFLGDVSRAPAEWVRQMTGSTIKIGDRWAIDAGRSGWFSAAVDDFVVTPSCFFGAASALSIDAGQRQSFSRVKEKYFPAHTLDGWTPPSPPARVGPAAYTVTPSAQQKIEQLLQEEFKRTSQQVLDLFSHRVDDPLRGRFEAKYKRLSAGEGRIRLDVQAFQVTPDRAPRLFVRAVWRLDGEPVYLMGAWVTTTPELAIEASNIEAARRPWFGEFKYSVFDPAANGEVLNVTDVDRDGTAEVLMLYRGYEGFLLELSTYPPAEHGGSRVVAKYGSGC